MPLILLSKILKGTHHEGRITSLLSGMVDTMEALSKHVKTTESGNKIFLENASSSDGVDERTPAGRLFSPGHSIGIY